MNLLQTKIPSLLNKSYYYIIILLYYSFVMFSLSPLRNFYFPCYIEVSLAFKLERFFVAIGFFCFLIFLRILCRWTCILRGSLFIKVVSQ